MKTISAALFLAAVAGCATTAASEVERNKAVARRAFSEILEQGRFEHLHDIYASDFRNGEYTLEQDMEALRALQKASPPDSTMRPELLVGEGEYVSVLWIWRGTTKAGKMKSPGVTIWQFRDGKIWREWSVFDERSVKEQLGLVLLSHFA